MTIEQHKRAIWKSLKACRPQSADWILRCYMELDPACCDRAEAVACASEWLHGTERGLDHLFHLEQERNRKRANRELARAISAARSVTIH